MICDLPHPIAECHRLCHAPTGQWPSTSDAAHPVQHFLVQCWTMAGNDILAGWTSCCQGSSTYWEPESSHTSVTCCTCEIWQLFIASDLSIKNYSSSWVKIHCAVDAVWLIYIVIRCSHSPLIFMDLAPNATVVGRRCLHAHGYEQELLNNN